MSFESIAGHKKQITFLQKSIEIGKVAHAYIFAGQSFTGKKLVAQEFAKLLLSADNEKKFHPDFMQINSEVGIKIEQVRDLIYKLSLLPYQSKYKIALIDNAEDMTVEAQNALLKVLEEPKSYTCIILVTSNPQKLLRTISSRAQKINFGPVASVDFEHLISGKTSKEASDLILSLAAGRPGLAISIATNQEFLEKLSQINIDYQIVKSNQLPEKLKLAQDMADLETPDIKQELEFWMIQFEKQLQSTPDMLLARKLMSITQARKYLDQNVNTKLLLTNLMLNLA
jgi:DNA polymerase-3 subunit delta'